MKDTDRLTAFVKEALAAGQSREKIRAVLSRAGWSDSEAATALAAWEENAWGDSVRGGGAALPPVPRPRPYVSAREVFGYGLLFVALVLTAWHLANLGVSATNYYLPEPGRPYPGNEIRRALAMLIVFFPLFLWMNARMNRKRRQPGARRSLARESFCYITLFIAALVLLFDLSFVVYTLLSGGASGAFFIKAAWVAAVAAAVLLYFRADIANEAEQARAT